MTVKPNRMHRWLAGELDELRSHRKRTVYCIAPRGNAKTTWGKAYVLQCVCEGTEPYILLIAETQGQAVKYLNSIKSELEKNQLIAADYPEVAGVGPFWSTTAITTRNGIRIEALGTRMAIRGRSELQYRPSLLMCDDLDGDNARYSQLIREKNWTWFTGSALKSGDPHTNVIVFGTMIHPDCVVGKIHGDPETDQPGQPGWRGRLWQSLIKEPLRIDLWDQWEHLLRFVGEPEADIFYEEHQAPMDEGAEVLWPEWEPLVDLKKMIVKEGAIAFASEKQNRPIPPEGTRFDQMWFEGEELWFDNEPLDSEVRLAAVDPAVGKDSRTGDYAAIVYCWWIPGDRYIYIDADIEVRPPPATVSRLVEIHDAYDLKGCAFEENGFQSVMRANLQEELVRRGTYFPVWALTHTENKFMRIDRLAPLLEGRYLRFRRGSRGAALLVRQLRLYSNPPQDKLDGPDALEMLMSYLNKYMLERGAEGGLQYSGSVTDGA